MKLLHERISDFAARFPEKAAVADAAGEISYAALESRSAGFAAALAAIGTAPGDAVAVYVPYAKEIILGAVSALRAGGVFIPFDDAYPVERLEYMLRDSGAKAILTVRSLWESKKPDFPEDRVLFLEEDPPPAEPLPGPPELTEDSPAMLLYTSGTTGHPKGVLHVHRMLLHIVDWIKADPEAAMGSGTRSGVMSSFSFVGSQMFLLGPLVHGGTVCIAPPEARSDLVILDRFLREARITHIFLPSGLAAILAEDYEIRGILIFAAGEKLRSFRPKTPGAFLLNSYGMTETGGVLLRRIAGNEPRITVGKPWKTIRVCLADEALNPVAPGQPGELLISSDFMARSYYRLPELSAAKWVERDGTLWFRTGDRAVLTPKGDIELLGRMDNMVKLRGFRVETGEVESQISGAVSRLALSGVGQIVVVVKKISGTEHLCCYYEAREELDRTAITAEIEKNLAEYMVPDVWVRMDAFPRNANGKVLRPELPEPRRQRMIVGALDSEVVARLVYTAADLLQIDGYIGPEDRFTDLGGTSLTAMKYASMLREQGIRITGARVLQLNTLRKIAEQAEVVYEQLWSPEEYASVRRDFAERGERILEVLPISSQQDELLFLQILHPDRASFQDIWFLQLDTPVAREHLRRALDQTAEENPALRSAIVCNGVSVIQQVIIDRRIPLEIMETESFGVPEMTELRRRLSQAPMDPQRGSMMRVLALRSPEKNFLCVITHRIAVSDALLRKSMARLMGLLEELYPQDASVSGWRSLFEMDLTQDGETAEKPEERMQSPEVRKGAPPEICVYSENAGPKLVFVHTGGTGSEAYYQLAARIGSRVSFAVIEPFNLYHMEEARYGIPNIAANYIRILKRFQPQGPYLLGGWCYGGVVAHEMACQLQRAGEEVRHLFMLDSHAIDSEGLRSLSRGMSMMASRAYFETSPLFAELRAAGMLEAMVTNAAHVYQDLTSHTPSVFHGNTTYFKPDQTPSGLSEEDLRYWRKMMEFDAGNFEHYLDRDKLRIVHTPHEHDLMMDDASLDIIVPEILRDIGKSAGDHQRV